MATILLHPLYYYYTTWNVILVCLHPWIHPYVNLLFSSFFVLVVGFFAVHLNHNFLKKDLNTITEDTYLRSFLLVAADVLFHVIPFIFILSKYKGYYSKKSNVYSIATSVLLIIIYMMLTDIKKVYNLTPLFITVLFIITYICYVFFLVKSV